MVRGLAKFKEHFRSYSDRYVLIGGTACSLAMEEVGLDFRATKDLDIVLCVEALDRSFVTAFWEFVHAGRYNNQQKSTGKRLFYRFFDPEDISYPAMLELFSRKPDALMLHDNSHLTPIPVDEDAASLSAILMENDYYEFIHAGKREIDGLPVAIAEYLIPLKARAWLDMRAKRSAGEPVDAKDIKKHRNDIFRLYQIVTPTISISLNGSIRDDFQRFLHAIVEEDSIDLKTLGLRNTTLKEIIEVMRRIYGIND